MVASVASKPSNRKSESPYKRLHVIIPIEDMLWASQQKPSVNQLWQECWTSDPYGSRWMPLSTTLGYSTFIQAKKVLSESGLFIFKPDKSIQDGRETVGWIVRNLHGSRMKDFWEEVDPEKQQLDSEKQQSNSEISEIHNGSEEMRASNQAPISNKTLFRQGLQKPSRTAQKHLTNSSKEIVRCDSSTPENSHLRETAHAPLGGASPQAESVEETEEDLPVATDCTLLTLVDAAQGQPTSLLSENKDCSEETKTTHEGVCSAPDKWSNEAIVERRELRPERENKLRLASMSGDNPGFNFLLECWEDVGLWNKIKQAIAQYPEWGVVYVGGKLVCTYEP
ncbi:MAG TPA: hypothetical protein VE944_29065 [Nostoc sp.]|uniref:hypothetical protein n=1 Tax=Nostoc sp. TaxID=1180 RepID=UPI002D3D78DA|nr:hypothetical protein [Nostoc sp.]HYX18346.1 hypothetical protein [Nostoc sp.]